jgi:hypothetical protein
MRALLLGLTFLTLASCVMKNSTGISIKKDTNIYSDTIEQNENNIENVVNDDVINTKSIKINGNIPFRTTRDSLLFLIKEEPIVNKVYEDCVSYGSKNDTLEYLDFNDSTIVFVYFNNHVEFVSIDFDNRDNKIVVGDYEISHKTTFEELCSKYPNSCKSATINKSTNEIIVRFHPRDGFYEYSEFWTIRFIGNRIKYMQFNMTC